MLLLFGRSKAHGSKQDFFSFSYFNKTETDETASVFTRSHVQAQGYKLKNLFLEPSAAAQASDVLCAIKRQRGMLELESRR